MQRMKIASIVALTLMSASLMSAGLTGCLFSPDRKQDPPPPVVRPPYHQATSPDSVLRNLEIAYRFRDIDGYDAILDTAYIFEPSPYDDLDFDELNRLQDYESTRKMFREVEGITIELTFLTSFESTFIDRYPPEDGFREIQVSNVRLAVQTRDEDTGEPLTLLVDNDQQTFVFRPDSLANPVRWTLVYQRDDHIGD